MENECEFRIYFVVVVVVAVVVRDDDDDDDDNDDDINFSHMYHNILSLLAPS